MEELTGIPPSFSLAFPPLSPNPFTLSQVGGRPGNSLSLSQKNEIAVHQAKTKPRPLVWVWVNGSKTGQWDGFHLREELA